MAGRCHFRLRMNLTTEKYLGHTYEVTWYYAP